MNKSILVAGIAVVVLVGIYVFLKPQENEEPRKTITTPTIDVSTTKGPTATESGTLVEKKMKTYTLAEVKKHDNKSDCWLAIENKVYDVTKFIAASNHPGGEAIVQGCGKDATGLFNTRPMGSNTPHSDKARSFLPNFYMGDLIK